MKLLRVGIYLQILLLTSLIFIRREMTSEYSIKPINIELSDVLTAQDFQNGFEILNALRSNEAESCAAQNGRRSESDPVWMCDWVTQWNDLRKLVPHGLQTIGPLADPPYKPYELKHIQNSIDFAMLVPVNEVIGGREALREWLLNAEMGKLIDCIPVDSLPDQRHVRMPDDVATDRRGGELRNVFLGRENLQLDNTLSCLAVVRNSATLDLRPLSLCQVVVIAGSAGAPDPCVLLAASSDSSQWMLAKVGTFKVFVASNGIPDFSFDLFFKKGAQAFGVSTSNKLETPQVLSAAESAIHSDPLRLQTRVGKYVLGVSPRRESPVLRAINEEVTVRIDVNNSTEFDADRKHTIQHFSFEVSTSILLNEHKDPNVKSWHKPSEEQTRSWTDAVRRRLNEELTRLCSHPNRKDDFTLVCN